MKNLSGLHAAVLFLFVYSMVDIVTGSQLDEFLKAIEEVNLNLDLNQLRSKRSPSIQELLSRFNEDEDYSDSNLEPGDAWYQSFRKMECLHGGDCSKRSLRWKTKKSQPEEDYEYYEEDDEPNLQDQLEDTQNDLSHEANYKLSKIEQDAVERKLPKIAWPIQHRNSKRNVDPMQAVKLKTSLRMLKNGDGPTLPSSFLDEDRHRITVEDILSESQHDDDGNPDPWKETYEVMESRKLLSVEPDSEDSPTIADDNICRSKDCLSHGMDMNQFDNIKQKTDLSQKLEGLSFDNLEENRVSKKGVFSTISDQLLNSEAFVKFQNFIKGKTDAGSNKTTTTTTIRPITSNPLKLVDKDRDVNIKFHMSVNATVLGNQTIPDEFHKNKTITFKPAAVKSKQSKKKRFKEFSNLDLERERRGVVFPILTSTSKRKAKEEVSKLVIEASDNFPMDEIITGKLTSQLVHTIFSLVKSSPNLKVLWPGLMKNKVSSPKQVQNFYAIRNHDNESEMQRTELMLRQAMETINAIIEQQVRSRSCVPLRADLKSFYELILQTQAEKSQFEENRRKSETPSSEDLNSPLDLDDFQIRQKSRIVKKLLKDYEELPRDDQDQIANIKESLLSAAEELKQFEETSRRRKRQTIANQYQYLLNQNSSSNSSTFLPQFTPTEDTHFTPQFLKLARTAEMISHNSIKDSDLTIDFNSI